MPRGVDNEPDWEATYKHLSVKYRRLIWRDTGKFIDVEKGGTKLWRLRVKDNNSKVLEMDIPGIDVDRVTRKEETIVNKLLEMEQQRKKKG
jgi:hypothetical protein